MVEKKREEIDQWYCLNIILIGTQGNQSKTRSEISSTQWSGIFLQTELSDFTIRIIHHYRSVWPVTFRYTQIDIVLSAAVTCFEWKGIAISICHRPHPQNSVGLIDDLNNNSSHWHFILSLITIPINILPDMSAIGRFTCNTSRCEAQ